MGESKECLGCRNEEIRLHKSRRKQANGLLIVVPNAWQICKRTMVVLAIFTLAIPGQANATQGEY